MTITVGRRSAASTVDCPDSPFVHVFMSEREDVLKGGHEAGGQRVRRSVDGKAEEPSVSCRTPQRGESPDQREEREEHESVLQRRLAAIIEER